MRLLSDCDSAPSGVEDRQVSERLWVLFLSVLENFLSDLRKARDLIGQFPLTQRYDRRSLVNTGQLVVLTSCLRELCDWLNHVAPFLLSLPPFLISFPLHVWNYLKDLDNLFKDTCLPLRESFCFCFSWVLDLLPWVELITSLGTTGTSSKTS